MESAVNQEDSSINIDKTLLSLIADNAKNYLTKEQVFDLLEDIKKNVVDYDFSLSDLYDVSIEFYSH